MEEERGIFGESEVLRDEETSRISGEDQYASITSTFSPSSGATTGVEINGIRLDFNDELF
ncbi:unnamed protein product, partial [Amoebophrya sp. A25]|eukprot:GSA25T00014798001.1